MSSVQNKLVAPLRSLEDDEIATKLREAKEELFNLRFQAATGQLESHGRLNAVRKEIARILAKVAPADLEGMVEALSAFADAAEDTPPQVWSTGWSSQGG